MEVREWAELSSQPISEHAIRDKFDYQMGYRFYPNKYEKGLSIATTIGWNVRVYVIDGQCTYRTQTHNWAIKRGQFLDLTPGEYFFETDQSPVYLMRVAYLPQLATINESNNLKR